MIDELCVTPEKHQFLHAGGSTAVIYVAPDGARLPRRRCRPTKKACSTPTSISGMISGCQGGRRSGRALCAARTSPGFLFNNRPGHRVETMALPIDAWNPRPTHPQSRKPKRRTWRHSCRCKRPSEGVMESAIPPHLQVARTRHRRVPDDYQPPYPAFVARHRARGRARGDGLFRPPVSGRGAACQARRGATSLETIFAAKNGLALGPCRLSRRSWLRQRGQRCLLGRSANVRRLVPGRARRLDRRSTGRASFAEASIIDSACSPERPKVRYVTGMALAMHPQLKILNAGLLVTIMRLTMTRSIGPSTGGLLMRGKVNLAVRK